MSQQALVLLGFLSQLFIIFFRQYDHFYHTYLLFDPCFKAIDFPASENGNVLDSSTLFEEVFQIISEDFPSSVPFRDDIQALFFIGVVILVRLLLFFYGIFSHPFEKGQFNCICVLVLNLFLDGLFFMFLLHLKAFLYLTILDSFLWVLFIT